MVTFTSNDLQRFTISALGALAISAVCIGAAIFPAEAAEAKPATAGGWQAEVEHRIDAVMQSPVARSNSVVMTEVAMHFDDRGQFRSASLARPSGISAVDQEALRVANTLRYPALPAHLQGKPRTVAMQIFFGNDGAKVRRQRMKADDAATALAAKTDASRQQAQIAAQPAG